MNGILCVFIRFISQALEISAIPERMTGVSTLRIYYGYSRSAIETKDFSWKLVGRKTVLSIGDNNTNEIPYENMEDDFGIERGTLPRNNFKYIGVAKAIRTGLKIPGDIVIEKPKTLKEYQTEIAKMLGIEVSQVKISIEI
jgi:hypothetical protein